MEYNSLFAKLLDPRWEHEYLGQGNPNSSILIIGKEHGFNSAEQSELEIEHNWKQWKSGDLELGYHPQICYRERDQRFTMKPNDGGTSSTWMAIQKLTNQIYPEYAVLKNERLNFFDYCFLTELSTCNRAMSGSRSDDTMESINHRLKSPTGILRQEFYRSFPIAILACHRYVDANMYDIDVQQLFDQQFIECIDLPNHEFINVHRNGDRLLLHTNHLSMRSDKFISEVANLCREHLSKLKK